MIKKSRWSKVYESSEEELLELLEAMGLAAERTHIDAFETLATRQHAEPTQLWCAEGSFGLAADGQTISMQPGDAALVPAGVPYEITAGISGGAWYETLQPSF